MALIKGDVAYRLFDKCAGVSVWCVEEEKERAEELFVLLANVAHASHGLSR